VVLSQQRSDMIYCSGTVGLRFSDEDVRVAVPHRLGCEACEPQGLGYVERQWMLGVSTWIVLPRKCIKTTTSHQL